MRERNRFWFGRESEATVECFRKEYPQACTHVLKQAELICQNTFVFREHWEMERTNEPVAFPDQIIWDHIPAGDPEWLYALNRHTFLLILGKAYRLTGEERYAEKYAALLKDWMERTPLTQESRQNTWRSLEAGIRVENWLKSLLLFADSPVLMPEFMDRIEAVLVQHGDYLMEVNEPFHHLSNWGVLQNHGLLLLGLWFDRRDWADEAVRRLDEEVYMQVFSDGSQWEQSPMYHCEVLYGLMDSLLHLKRFERLVPKRLEEAVQKMVYALAHWCKPDGHLPCHGDSDDIDARDLIAEGALLFGDGKLKRMAQGAFLEDDLWNFGVRGKLAYEAMAAVEPEATSIVLADAGNYLIRSGWRADADYVRLHCGCMGSGHGHGDQLHVDYFSRGEDVLIDPGRYTYVDSPIRKALKMPSGHNTVCVDGEAFCDYVDTWGYGKMALPVKGEYRFQGVVNFAVAGHLGYLDRGLFATRKVVTLEEGLIVLADVFYGKGQHSYESRFHFGSQGWASLAERRGAEAARVVFQGKNMQAQLLVMKGEAALTKADCSLEYNLLAQCDRLSVCYRKAGQASMYTVISTSGSDGQEIDAQVLSVSKVRSGGLLREEQAEAVRIVKNGKEHVVIFCHQELISEVDYFTAAGYASYGKTLVFSEDNREGICVQY